MSNQGKQPTTENMRWMVDHLCGIAALVSLMGRIGEPEGVMRGALAFLADATLLANKLSDEGIEEWRNDYRESLAASDKGVSEYERMLARKARSRDS